MIIDPYFYLFAIPAVLIMGISKGGFAGGFGMLAVPLIAMVIDPRQAAAIMLPILCVMDIFTVKAFWKKWDYQSLYSLVPGAVLGIVIGTITFRYLDGNMIRLIIGIVTIYFVLQYWLLKLLKKEDIKKTYNNCKGTFLGLLSGFTSFIAHAGGSPVSMYLFPLKLDKTVLISTSSIFFMIVNYTKLIPYAWLGQLSSENLLTSLILLPLAPVGVKIGVWMLHKMSNQFFYTICYIALFITGAKLIYDGLAGL